MADNELFTMALLFGVLMGLAIIAINVWGGIWNFYFYASFGLALFFILISWYMGGIL